MSATATITPTELLEAITQDVFRLTYVWNTFKYLYASDKQRVEVLNATSGGFFLMTQRLLFDDAILSVARLTDPAGNKHQENVSLEQLLAATAWETSEAPQYQVYREKLDQVEMVCKPCRAHRNKRVSHKALSVLQKTFALPDANMRMIDAPLAAIQEFLREISIALGNGDISFEFITLEDHTERLLRHLTNRASQKDPDAISMIIYTAGNTQGTLHCAFCGSKELLHYYPTGEPTPRRMVRRHFETCHGVIGCETITVETYDDSQRERPTRFTVDLKIPARET